MILAAHKSTLFTFRVVWRTSKLREEAANSFCESPTMKKHHRRALDIGDALRSVRQQFHQSEAEMAVTIMGKAFRAKELVTIGLKSKFYGLAKADVQRICAKLGLYPMMRMHQLSEQQVLGITKELSELTIEGDARAVIRQNIALKRAIGSYAGIRHAMGLPVRGQKTRTNAKTARKLNRIERRGFATFASAQLPTQHTGVLGAFKNFLKPFF